MADYKEILGSLVNKAKDAMEQSGVGSVYQRGADRAKVYSRIARLTLSMNGQTDELRKVYTEIGKLYYQQAKDAPEGFFAPLFAQAGKLLEELDAKDRELEELKASLSAEKEEKDIEVEITEEVPDFDAVVDATENDGKGEE